MSNRANSENVFVEPGRASSSFGEILSLMGVNLTYKAVSADTDGQWSLLEYDAPPNFPGVPAHWHKQMTEAFYLLGGRLFFDIAGRRVETSVGAFVLVPPGTVHTWWNPDASPAKFLVLTSPGGFENYMRELIASMKAEPVWPPADLEKYRMLGERHDTYAPPAETK